MIGDGFSPGSGFVPARATAMVCALACALTLCHSAAAAVIMKDDFEGKLNADLWAPAISWNVDGGVLEILRDAGDGNGPDDFGYGVDVFTDFGLQMDFRLGSEPQASKIELLFRATEFAFYQLVITPANGFGRKNSARWYRREGEDRGTWKEYTEFRAELPITVTTDAWYSLGLRGNGFDFEVHIKERGALNAQLVSAWTDADGLHSEGTIGFHTNQGHNYKIDNVALYDNPADIQGFLPVEPLGKAALAWATLKR
ncbi:MAG: hypothetical protein QF672_07285 [SAR202 cluster bacterium]|nr:hypothetical protein [SAR202 cluster bacterium]